MASSDTIAAIATAVGEASIAIIRVSGEQALEIVNHVFVGSESLIEVPTHTIWYGHIISLKTHAIVDEVLVSVMKAPRTYTTEDVVEISTHGGFQVVQDVLSEVLRAGARLAQPGEFTKRAFLGGRVDLTQAEGVMELIKAHSLTAKTAALRQIEGSLVSYIKNTRKHILELLAHIEVTIDYPEHDVEDITARRVYQGVLHFKESISNLLSEANSGRILQEGLRVAIIGRPNVGKSSLMNQFARMDRAIVTDIPGTTRDVIEQYIQIQGIPISVFDTAGIRDTDDPVEMIGVEKSRRALEEADFLIVMIDQSRELSATDFELLENVRRIPSLVLLSKSDMIARFNRNSLPLFITDDQVMNYTVFDPSCFVDLEKYIVGKVFLGQVSPKDLTFVANSRHIRLLESTLEHLEEVIIAIDERQTLDLVAVDLQAAWMELGEIIGETPKEDLLDQIFSQFCLGK